MPTKPDTTVPRDGRTGDVLVEIDGLSVHFELRGSTFARLLGRDTGSVKAVDGVDLTLHRGEVVGLVGESGSGKSTLGRALLGLVPITAGSVVFDGTDIAALTPSELRQIRQHVQMVFQDPNAALNPAMTVEQSVGDPLRVHGMRSASERRDRVVETLERVNLVPVDLFLGKYPSDLSGGQKQRVVIARSIIMGPSLLVADEPISMLDMSVRAKILQLMLDLRRDMDLTYVYITHDLASAKFFCDRIAIMYLGRVVETGDTQAIFANPKHPYTKALLAAIPDPDPERSMPRDLLKGEIPDAARPPLGCAFHPRCPEAFEKCGWEPRDLVASLEAHWLKTGITTFDIERNQIANLDTLNEQEGGDAHLKAAGDGTPDSLNEMLEEVRRESSEARFWSGVESTEPDGTGVAVSFAEGSDPRLRRSGDVEVACHLYGEDV